MAAKEENFLPRLMKAFTVLEQQSSVNTKDFIDAIEKLFPVFDHLGKSVHTILTFSRCVLSHCEKAVAQDVQHRSILARWTCAVLFQCLPVDSVPL